MFKQLSRIILIGLLGCTVLGYFGRIHWTFDILANFRIQYTLVAAAFALVQMSNPRKPLPVLALCALALNIASIAPYYQPIAFADATNGTTLRAVTANVKANAALTIVESAE